MPSCPQTLETLPRSTPTITVPYLVFRDSRRTSSVSRFATYDVRVASRALRRTSGGSRLATHDARHTTSASRLTSHHSLTTHSPPTTRLSPLASRPLASRA